MKSITKLEKSKLLGFVKHIGGPESCQRCVQTKNSVDLVYFQCIKNNPNLVMSIVTFGDAADGKNYVCKIRQNSEDRDFTEKFNNYLNSLNNNENA